MDERKDEAPQEDEIVFAEAGDDEEAVPEAPVGAPQPELKDPPVLSSIGWVTVATAVGIFLFPMACPVVTTSGAPRSARIVWEERRAEAAQAVEQAREAEAAHGSAAAE
jgi:hypothetical protein